MYKSTQPRGDIYRFYELRKKLRKEFVSIEDYVEASKKDHKRLITTASNSNITKNNLRKEKQQPKK